MKRTLLILIAAAATAFAQSPTPTPATLKTLSLNSDNTINKPTAFFSANVTPLSAALAAIFQPLDSDLTSIAALSTTTFGRSLLTQADAAAARTTLGLGTAALSATTDFATASQGSLAASAVQPARTITAGTGLSGGGDLSANRTISLAADAARANLSGGNGTLNLSAFTLTLPTTPIAQGGTGAANAATALSNLGGQPLDSELTAISALSSNGIVTRTSPTTAAARSIVAGNGLSITNGDGVGGNITVNFAANALDEFRSQQQPVPALKRLTDRLKAGYSDSIGLIGDSTSSGNGTWWYAFQQALGAAVGSSLRVVERRENSSGNGTGWIETVLQSGNGEPYTLCPIGGASNRSVNISESSFAFAGDLDLRFKISVDQFPTGGLLLSQLQDSTSRTIQLTVGQGGGNTNVLLEVYDQSNTLRQYFFNNVWNNSNFPANTPCWLRVTLDIDNGASGSTAQLFRSTSGPSEGATWTQIGSNATVGAVITGFNSNTGPCEILGRQTSSICPGVKVYRVELRHGGIGDAQPVLNNQVPHTWGYNYSATSQVKPDAWPTLWVISYSIPGFGIPNYLTKNFNLITPRFGQSVYILSTGYNDTTVLSAWQTDLESVRTATLAVHPNAAFVPVAQPPERTTAQTYYDTSWRAEEAARWATNKYSVGYIPANEAFRSAVASGTLLTDLVGVDTRHPTAAGYTLWRDTALRSFGIKP